MKFNITFLIFLSSLFTMHILCAQDFFIKKTGDKYQCLTVDNAILYESKLASQVIQYAVNSSHENDGGVIILNSGTYELNKPIELKTGIALKGMKVGTELKLEKPNDICIEINDATNVEVSDLTISTGNNGNSLSGIYIKNSSGLNLSGITTIGFSNFGIYISAQSENLKINRCTFLHNQQSHIFLEDIQDRNNSIITISNCNFFSGGYGITSTNTRVQHASFKISDNIFSYLKGMAIDTDCDSVSITGNKLYWIGLDGMRISGQNFYMAGNINSWIRGHGLVLDGAKNGSIVGNNFTDLGVRSLDGMRKCGIAMYNSSNIDIKGNSIWNFGDQGYIEYAVYENPDCSDNNLLANAGWFHYFKNAFKIMGKSTTVKGNTSNRGEFRRSDFWDFSQKYSYSIEKYLKKIGYASVTHPEPYQISIPEISGEKIIECKDQFNQVLTISDSAVQKNGWIGSPNQVWELKKTGNFYRIINTKTNHVLQMDRMEDGNCEVVMKPFNNQTSQLWRLERIGRNYYKIINQENNKVLSSQGFISFNWEKNEVGYEAQDVYLDNYKILHSQLWSIKEPIPVYNYQALENN